MKSQISIIALIGTLAFGAGCGSSSNGTAATGGTPGIAGIAGIGGSGGASQGCNPSNTSTAPADGLIADFMNGTPVADPTGGGSRSLGGIVTFGPPGIIYGPASPTYSVTGGTLNITESAPATSVDQHVGLAVDFNNCIDASAFTGVQFTISGSFSGCSIGYGTADSEHDDSTFEIPHATGPAGSYLPLAQLTAAQVTSTPMPISMPFNGTGAPSYGNPASALDPTKLTEVEWVFTIPAAAAGDGGTPMCTANLTIDNVKFYP
jgi:hypothetical protein